MSSVRKKRNFKGLHLADTPLSPPVQKTGTSSSSSTNTTYDKLTAGTTSTDTNVPSTAKSSTLITASSLPSTDPTSGANYHNKLSEQLANLELGVEYKLDLKNEDLIFLSELGSGNGGTVTKVLHQKSGTTMAKKVVFIDAKPTIRKQILRELQILHECNSPHIVSFYGAYLAEPHICMCMEYMDCGSLDVICRRNGPIRPDVCGKIVVVVVHGLTYLYDVHRIIHRDVKPSNILVNTQGQIKICDFGVSGELINSIADTFVGTSTYMSPERIQGDQYSVKSDVWSLGISVIEVALGRFPFMEDSPSDEEDDDDDADLSEELRGTLSNRPEVRVAARTAPQKAKGEKKKSSKSSSYGGVGAGSQMSILDLLQHIVNEPAPRMPRDDARFKPEMCDFVDLCLRKDPSARPSPKELTKNDYVKKMDSAKVDLLGWVKSLKM
ncbi:hypothetical protein CBS101457_006077 [Exobasidium rhododendri]|nr:hypothetical protein CBS101457_006077 [Exobasidium rhododendri]